MSVTTGKEALLLVTDAMKKSWRVCPWP